MNRPRDPHVPASAWADTQRIAPLADLGSPATQIVGDRDAYLGGQGDVGRRIAEDQVELFITGDVAGALQREFQAHASEFMALHDIGSSGSLRLLGSLAGSAGARVQRLSVRRQGHGLALAVLQFVEVPLADGSLLRVYSTDINADGPARQQVARVLLAYSQLGVLMVGDMPLHAVTNALHPLHEQMARGLWPNRELLLVPLAGNATLATQGAQLSAGSPVAVHVAPRAAKPRQVWAYIAGAWNRLHGAPAGRRGLHPDIAQVVPRPAVPSAEAETQPMGLDPLVRPGSGPAPQEHVPAAAAPAPARAPAPMPMPVSVPPPAIAPVSPATAFPPIQPFPAAAASAAGLSAAPPAARAPAAHTQAAHTQAAHTQTAHTPAAELPSGFAQRGAQARPPSATGAQAMPLVAVSPMPMPVPGATRWQNYADRCLGIRGVVSVCVFDTHNLQPLAHAGGAPSGERLAQQGALLMAEMVDVARALGFGATRPDAAISLGAYHLVLQHVPGHPGIALHLVLQASATHLTVARVQLERVEVPH